jgi:hypothetical protein
MEGVEPLGSDIHLLRAFHELGVPLHRIVDEDRGANESDPAVVELRPELAAEDADPLVHVDTLLVEIEKQVEMEIDDAVMNASHPSVEFLEYRQHAASRSRICPHGGLSPASERTDITAQHP